MTVIYKKQIACDVKHVELLEGGRQLFIHDRIGCIVVDGDAAEPAYKAIVEGIKVNTSFVDISGEEL